MIILKQKQHHLILLWIWCVSFFRDIQISLLDFKRLFSLVWCNGFITAAKGSPLFNTLVLSIFGRQLEWKLTSTSFHLLMLCIQSFIVEYTFLMELCSLLIVFTNKWNTFSISLYWILGTAMVLHLPTFALNLGTIVDESLSLLLLLDILGESIIRDNLLLEVAGGCNSSYFRVVNQRSGKWSGLNSKQIHNSCPHWPSNLRRYLHVHLSPFFIIIVFAFVFLFLITHILNVVPSFDSSNLYNLRAAELGFQILVYAHLVNHNLAFVSCSLSSFSLIVSVT